MLRGRISGDDDEKDVNSPPDRLIHFEPEDSSSDSSQEDRTVFGTYYKNIASDESDNVGSKLFGKKTVDNFGNPNSNIENTSVPENVESSAVKFQPDEPINEDLSDSSFPLFVSFKANDPAKTVSEALRDKGIPDTDEPAKEDEVVQSNEFPPNVPEEFIDSSVDPFDIPFDDLSVPIFKPIIAKPTEENTASYDIPKVFENDNVSVPTTEVTPADELSDTPLLFPLSDIPEEPKTIVDVNLYEGTVLTDSSQNDKSDTASDVFAKSRGKKSGFSLFPELNDISSTSESEQSYLTPSDDRSVDASLPVFDKTPVSEIVSDNLAENQIDEPLIFTPSATSLNMAGDLSNDLTQGKSIDLPVINESIPDPSETAEVDVSPVIKTRGSSRVKNDSVASVLKDDGFAVFKEVNNNDNESSPKDDAQNIVLTERPGRNYSPKEINSTVSPSQKGVQANSISDRMPNRYTAAQQMGTVAPLPQRAHKKRRSGIPIALIIIIIIVILLVGFWFAWMQFDLGSVFANMFGSKKEPQVSTFQTQSTASASSSASSDNSTETSETTVPPTATPTPTPSPTPTTAPTETTVETTAETTVETTAATTVAPGEPTKFVTKVLNGSSDGATAYFDLQFENTGAHDSSLVDSIKQITITFESSKTIEEVTSSFFTFVKKEGTTNVFIGTPTSTAIIMQDDIVLVDITGVTSGDNVGKFTVKYYVEYNS